MKFKLSPIPEEMFGGLITFNEVNMKELFTSWRKWCKYYFNDRDFSTTFFIKPLPKPTVTVSLMHLSSSKIGEEIMGELIKIGGEPLSNNCQMRRYSEIQGDFESFVDYATRNKWTSRCISHSEMTDDFFDSLLDRGVYNAPEDCSQSIFSVELWGGAINDKNSHFSPIPVRGSDFVVSLRAGWTDAEKDREHTYWLDGLKAKLTEYSSKHRTDFAGYESDPSLRDDKLYKLKEKYDPHKEVIGAVHILTK
jgi:hypothetical protein